MDDGAADRGAGTLGRRRFLALAAGAAAGAAAPRRAGAPERPVRGGVLKQIGLEPPTFDVHATASDQTQLVSSFVRRTLFKLVHGARYGPSDFTLAPDLALKAVASADGRTYTITLRPGVRWESRPPVNGRELVAADVKYSLERVAAEVALRAAPGPGGADRRARPAHRARPPGGFLRPVRPQPGRALDRDRAPGGGGSAGRSEGRGVPDRLRAVRARALRARGEGGLLAQSHLPRPRPAVPRQGGVALHQGPLHPARALPGRAGGPALPRWAHPALRGGRVQEGQPGLPGRVLGRAGGSLAGHAHRPAALQRRAGAPRAQPGGGPEDVGGRASRRRGRRGSRAGAERHAAVEAGRAGSSARAPAISSTIRRWPARSWPRPAFPRASRSSARAGRATGPSTWRTSSASPAICGERAWSCRSSTRSTGSTSAGHSSAGSRRRAGGPPRSSRRWTGISTASSGAARPATAATWPTRSSTRCSRRSGASARRRRARGSSTRSSAAPPRRSTTCITPYPRNVSSWAPRVRNYGPKNSFDRGAQLEVVWLDPA